MDTNRWLLVLVDACRYQWIAIGTYRERPMDANGWLLVLVDTNGYALLVMEAYGY